MTKNNSEERVETTGKKNKTNKTVFVGIIVFLFLLISTFIYMLCSQRSSSYQEKHEATESSQLQFQSQKEVTSSNNLQLLTEKTDYFDGEIAFIRDENLWIARDEAEKQLTNDAIPAEIPFYTGLPEKWYSDPAISPNGEKIAFLKNSGTNTRTLCIIDVDGNNYEELAQDVNWYESLVRWSHNGTTIFYITTGNLTSDDKRSIHRINVENGNVEQVGSYDYQGGCGGATGDVSRHFAAEENIASGGSIVSVFEISSNEKFLVVSISCGADRILVLDLSTKEQRFILERAARAIISSDSEMIAAATPEGIKIYDSDDGKVLYDFQVEEPVDTLCWLPKGRIIYFSTHILNQTLTVDDGISLPWGTGTTFAINQSTLWKLDLKEETEKIMEYNTNYIKPIYAANNEVDVIITEVENSDKLYQYITEQKTIENLVDHYPKVNVRKISIPDKKDLVLALDAQQAYYENSNPSSYKTTRRLDLEDAALKKINQYPELIKKNYTSFEVGNVNIRNGWAFLNLRSYPENPPQNADAVSSEIILAIGEENVDGKWSIYLETEDIFTQKKFETPDTLISQEAKDGLMSKYESQLENQSQNTENAVP